MQVSAPDYSNKSDDELLALASDVDSLTTEARNVLRVALKTRGLDPPIKIANFVEEQNRLSLADDVSRLGLSWRGNGRGTYGKFKREISGLHEEYDTTVFLVLSYFPVIPTAAYRVSREQQTKQLRFLSKIPLDWSQVVWTWAKSSALLAGGFALLVAVARISAHR